MKSNIYKGFILFEALFSIVITNIAFIGLSFLSILILTPVLLVSTFICIRRVYLYKEYQGIIFRFIFSAKGRIIRSFQVLYPALLFLAVLIASVLYYNQIMDYYFSDMVISIVILIQLLVIYQTVAIILLSALYLTIDTKMHALDIYKASFLLFNANPLKGFLSMISLIAMILFIVEISWFGYLIFIPLSLFAFYTVFSKTFETRTV